ncbi:MAG: ATP-binding cassette domain-containing protein [Planctomycetes bacterium]|nr:ATP-binding cassette domain-containing protein [Planctomycetota bacterium]
MISIEQLTIGFRGPPLLDEVNCQIEPRQRIGLLGRNGAGKTTLLRILCGQVEPDHGQVRFAADTRVSMLEQDVPLDLTGSTQDIVAAGLAAVLGNDNEADAEAPWKSEQQVEQILSRMDLDPTARFELLSSGMKRRVLLARALVGEPDVLLLDEPTNHLDIETIGWLEEFLARWNATLIFVTHDREFLRRLANRILEIDRGRLFDWSCDYETFLNRKEAALAATEKQDALFDKKLAEEEKWIRQGIKARRTRNEGRVRALQKMRRERSERRTAPGKVRMTIQSGRRSGNLVAQIDEVSLAFDEKQIVQDFSTTIMRGDKIGIVGPNGAGKTTLLRILLGQLSPDAGSVRLGTNLQIAYFDQLREQLDVEKTVAENIGDGGDTLQIGGRSKHVLGYLQDFLFAPERARTPVRFLSGGERNRLLLARLFAKPANVIVLDEPTNDLDTETLELLEERLVEFDGTVLLVSHDRAFLNNVVTSTIVFEASGVREYDGGYDDWLRVCESRAKEVKDALATTSKTSGKSERAKHPQQDDRRRLSYHERRELEALPRKIEPLEAGIAELHQAMAEPDFYKKPGAEISRAQARLRQLETDLAAAFERWEDLEQTG